ncbi:hypothetical protein GE09DRAFT_1224623 [Coniochaeta sp. 2T2.1]|nr:hypothetical protein GE09DRAFT_1224623 [Coniochaeta sp. 2T2.1]
MTILKTILCLVAAFLASTLAIPTDDTSPVQLLDIGSKNQCGDPTFADQGSDASPFASDCLQIAANIGRGGLWRASAGAHHQLVQYYSCAFGDIIDLIQKSVRLFARPDGRVGSKGDMKCHAAAPGSGVLWGLY